MKMRGKHLSPILAEFLWGIPRRGLGIMYVPALLGELLVWNRRVYTGGWDIGELFKQDPTLKRMIYYLDPPSALKKPLLYLL